MFSLRNRGGYYPAPADSLSDFFSKNNGLVESQVPNFSCLQPVDFVTRRF